MDQATTANDSEELYPFLLVPRKCTALETNCNTSENVFIDVNITSPDTEGNETCIYSGFCNIKLIDNYNININEDHNEHMNENDLPVIISENNQISYPPYNQSQVWIDPARSPYVYNNYNVMNPTEHYSVYHQTKGHITVEQHNTYITQTVYNYNESVQYSVAEDIEQKKFRKTHETQNNEMNYNLYAEDEFECGVFLSQLPEEIMNEKENKAREERKFIGLQSDNGALKQLMSSDIQSMSKQRKTILFLGHDSQSGQTIQNILVNDPMLECSSNGEVENEVIIEDLDIPPNPHQKKYQCDKCKQIFDQITAFKQHMVANHRLAVFDEHSKTEVKFMCTECGKTLKNQEKFEIHCMGHGDPDLECNKCHKVFASKFTLRAHRKIHTRKYVCHICIKTYSTNEELKNHMEKIHFYFSCHLCSYVGNKFSDLTRHQALHLERDATSSVDSNVSETDIITPSPEGHVSHSESSAEIKDIMLPQYDQISDADSVIAKVMSNKIFLLHAKKVTKRHRIQNKTCEVCCKKFERIGDLKRHLIEHIIKSTLSKTPVSNDGTLTIECEVCHTEIFNKIDRYKAHLREHAKLTLYKCTFCDKSFSDSSNFSKHKKIHSTTFFQCDLCQRKFNSKKTLTQHIEYHNNNSPIQCTFCDKMFHFESILNKHIRCTHYKEVNTKFRCKFCHSYFRALKDKWDHEWSIHSVRKMIVDCLICGAKFRKYSELKRHCVDEHKLDIPPAKKLLRRRK